MLVALTLCISAKGKAQLYDSLAKGIPSEVKLAYYDSVLNNLYISGFFWQTNDSVPIHGIGAWNGSNWETLSGGFFSPPPFGGYGGYAYSGARYEGHIYFTGPISFVDTVAIDGIARWNGVSWDSLPNSHGAGGYQVLTHDSSLYLCGNFNSINYDPSIKVVARWNGFNWSAIGNPLTIIKPGFNPTCIAFLNNNLYVGGTFETIGGAVIHLIKWDGTDWTIPGNGILEGGTANIWDIEVYKDELYITGYFSKFATGGSGTSQYLTKWDGTQFKNVGGDGPDDWCMSLCVHNDKLYLGGTFTHINGMPARGFASFDGTDWCSYNAPSVLYVNKIAEYRGDTLLLGGNWFIEGGDTLLNVALWTGDSFVDTCKIANGINESKLSEHRANVFPNPNNGNFTLEFDNRVDEGELVIVNNIGQIVFEREIIYEKSIVINLSSYSNGIYHLAVNTPDKRFATKFIKE